MSPQSFYAEALIPNVTVSEGGTLGSQSGLYKVMRVGPPRFYQCPYKERRGRETRFSSLCHGRTQQEGGHLQAGNSPRQEPAPDTGLLNPQNCKKYTSVVLATQAVVFCYSSPRCLRHSLNGPQCGVLTHQFTVQTCAQTTRST